MNLATQTQPTRLTLPSRARVFDWILKFWVPRTGRLLPESNTTRLKYRSRSPTERSSRVQPTLLKLCIPGSFEPKIASRRLTHQASRSPPRSSLSTHSHGFEGSRIESFIRLTIGYSYKLLLRAPRWLNRREPPDPKAALLNRPGEPSQPPMNPSVTGLDAPNRPATHPPTQPDEPTMSQSGYRGPWVWYPRAFQRESRLALARLPPHEGAWGTKGACMRICTNMRPKKVVWEMIWASQKLYSSSNKHVQKRCCVISL